MAVAFSIERVENPDTTNQTAYTVGAAFTPAANTLLVLCGTSVDTADATYSISSVAGGSLTWSSIRAALASGLGDTQFWRLESFSALVGGSPVSTTVVVTHSEAVTGYIGWVGEFTGHDTTTPIKSGQTADATGATDPSISLPAVPDSDSLVLATGMVARNPAAWTEEAGWTEHEDTGMATPNTGAAVYSKANDQSFTAAGVDLTWAFQIYEIDALAAPGPPATKFFTLLGVGVVLPLLARPVLLRSWTSVNGRLVAAWVHPLRDVILAARDGLYVPTTREISALALAA